MLKSLTFSVQVGKEMLGTFWQVEYRLKIYDLCACLGNISVRVRKEIEVMHVSLDDGINLWVHNRIHFVSVSGLSICLAVRSYRAFIGMNPSLISVYLSSKAMSRCA